jgi:CubicO group peptidase (beta-lactamase class C family)
LRFNEGYGDVSDVTRMLYLEPDMAGFVHALPLEQSPGKVWSYSSGTTVLLSHILQNTIGKDSQSYAHNQLFLPLGMSSAIIEADARGTLVGSSYMYASAPDWARFAQFLLQDGVWNGKRLLPAGYVDYMREAAPASMAAYGKAEYGKGQLWRRGAEGGTPEGENPDAAYALPDDTFWMSGHDGESIAIVPSKQLVVVRLGLTPKRLAYQPQGMLQAVIRVLE